MKRSSPIAYSRESAFPPRRERLFSRVGGKQGAVQGAADSVLIEVMDEIGGWGISASQFSKSLAAAAGKPLVVAINSPGGDVFDGLAIHNMLLAHAAPVRVEILGVAASIASIIAMAGDTVAIAQNGFLMLHKSWGLVIGNADDHREQAQVLDQIDTAMARTYASKAGRDDTEMMSLMEAVTWLDGAQAIEAGLATELLPDPDRAALARYDLSIYRGVPAGLSAQAPQRAEIQSHTDIARMLVSAGVRQGAAKTIATAGFRALAGTAPHECQALIEQIAVATAQLKGND